MKKSIKERLKILIERYEELCHLLSDIKIINKKNMFRKYSKEYSRLEPIVMCFNDYCKEESYLDSLKEILKDKDPEIRKMAKQEFQDVYRKIQNNLKKIEIFLLPQKENYQKNIFLEIRAGTGGKESCIFAGDLFRMYRKYSENHNWKLIIINQNFGEHGGYKEIIAKIYGENVYTNLQFESGIHRVQRIPLTESQGRIHTSACTVAILKEVPKSEEIKFTNNDLRIDTFRSSGAGGQHVNKTDSAIRITHLQTGIVVECQDERSQHKNKARAMSLLKAKIFDQEKKIKEAKHAKIRKKLIGGGDRSERIRTYNFPQSRITDHRINLTLYKLEDIMSGNLSLLIKPILKEYKSILLSKK